MFLDFIEIGTSDFDTEIQKDDDKVGISVEPIKYYIDRLPDKKGCKKIQTAISNINGSVTVYYVPVETIQKYNLHYLSRGCNTINSYHPTITSYLAQVGVDIKDVANSYEVPCKTILDIIKENNVSGVYYLKIDTEGHDTVILKKFYNDIKGSNTNLPHVILFESNILSDRKSVDKIIELYQTLGYDLLYSEHDTMLKLNLNNLQNKSSFTNAIENYYIINYPDNYNPVNPPHNNTLEDAKRYCIENNCSGITYQYGRYEVRSGSYIYYYKENGLLSWIYI